MADKLEGNTSAGRTRSNKPKPETPKPAIAKPKRKSEPPTDTVDLTGRFLRVGNKLYRTSNDKNPIVRIEPDRLITNNIDALPDIVRMAKASGWTSIRINGGDRFKKAAFLAAAAQGLDVENYTPSKVLQAEADRLRTRLAEREQRREAKESGGAKWQIKDELSKLKVRAERFLSQSHAENARDPELRRAQKLVAQTISIARAKYPDDPVKASKDVGARRQEVAIRIANGDKITVVPARNQQTQQPREKSKDHASKHVERSR